MKTETRSGTETITASDVRQVWNLATTEISVICNAAAHLTRDFDVDSALVDVSLLALNDIIASVHLQLYVGDELVREHGYFISDEVLEAAGPPPNQPPLGRIPEGARIRLVAMPNPRQPQAICDAWFQRLGWMPADPLQMPDTEYSTYGTFTSGGYGVERKLLINPKYDRPVSGANGRSMRKER